MPGKVVRVVANPGDSVNEGDPILVLEAMKMEMEVTAPVGGTIASVNVSAGDQVGTGDVLAAIA